MNEAFGVCRDEFTLPTFLAFPLTCQAALLDIAYNCGGFGTFRRHFIPAIKGIGVYAEKARKERWSIAAEHSRRGQVGLKRNAVVKNWLLAGAKISVTAEKVEQ